MAHLYSNQEKTFDEKLVLCSFSTAVQIGEGVNLFMIFVLYLILFLNQIFNNSTATVKVPGYTGLQKPNHVTISCHMVRVLPVEKIAPC